MPKTYQKKIQPMKKAKSLKNKATTDLKMKKIPLKTKKPIKKGY